MDILNNTVIEPGSTKIYINLLVNLQFNHSVSKEVIDPLWNYTGVIYRAELGNEYTKPISWIGLYIAAASLFCVFAMAADLFHGLRHRKLWFPCKYFTINAAFLSVISAAMKLPMDISTSMPGNVDQVTKLGSMAFLCTMMANFLPSQATMNSKELLTNITGLGVMVITLVVNLCIQIHTGVVSYKEYDQFYNDVLRHYFSSNPPDTSRKHRNIMIAIIYLSLLLLLLIIHICSSLAILKSKEMIDVEYKKLHKPPSDTNTKKTVQQLHQHVSNYWIMAGSPQFRIVCFVTTSACGVICVLSTGLHIRTLFWTIGSVKGGDYDSDYQWSMLVIFIIQFIGVILGTIAPLCRCFAALCFEVSIESIQNQIKVFKVENYWTDKLYEWKLKCITLPFRNYYKYKVITEHAKICFLNLCIAFQVAVVVTCKIISLVPVFMICVFYCLKCLSPKSKDDESNKMIQDLHPYVLHLQGKMKVSGTTLNCLSGSTIRLIKKGERQQPRDLLELMKKSIKGGENFDGNLLKNLLSKNYCWSLPVVNLTIIAVSLPDIDTSKIKKLLRSVREGLEYVTHVEESLNTTDDSVSSQKAARTLWHEFEIKKMWLGNNRQELGLDDGSRNDNSKCKSICAKSMYLITDEIKKMWLGNNRQEIASKKEPKEIVQLFYKKSEEEMVKELGLDDGSRNDNSKCKSICATSMYLITDEILLSYAADDVNQLFEHISLMISGLLADCLTNLPKVIETKCHTIEIEKREAAVKAEAILLGETTQIINTLQRADPHQCLNPNDNSPLIEKWCACFYHKI